MRAAISEGQRVKCVVLKGFAGLLNETTQEHTTFAKEFSDRIRVIACLTRLPNMVHSDAASESLYGRDWQKLRKTTSAADNDVLILVWGDEADAGTACQECVIRAREATVGVPNDTRQALKDGTNGFERVLPGADRMYPDTDLPPLAIPEERVEQARQRLPEYVWDREARYRAMGLPKDTIEVLSTSSRATLFTRLVDKIGTDSTFAAVVLCQRFRAFRRWGLDPDVLTDDEIAEVFEAHGDGLLAREGVVKVLRHAIGRRVQKPEEQVTLRRLLDSLKISPCGDDEYKAHVVAAVGRLDHDRFSTAVKKHRYLMGVLMAGLIGRVDGSEVARVLTEELDPQRDGGVSATVSA